MMTKQELLVNKLIRISETRNDLLLVFSEIQNIADMVERLSLNAGTEDGLDLATMSMCSAATIGRLIGNAEEHLGEIEECITEAVKHARGGN